MPAYNSEVLRSTLAWTYLMQGKADAARKLLAEALAKMDQRRWNDRQQKSASELSIPWCSGDTIGHG
jgi:hypothetical protein